MEVTPRMRSLNWRSMTFSGTLWCARACPSRCGTKRRRTPARTARRRNAAPAADGDSWTPNPCARRARESVLGGASTGLPVLVLAGLRVLGQADRAGLGCGPHRTRLGRADEAPRLP